MIEQDVQAEIKLDKSIREQHDLLEAEMRVEPNFTEETRYPVNQHIVEIVIETLTAMGIQDPEELIAEWSSHHFHSMANFWEACQEYNQEYKLGNNQITAYLNLLNDKFYSVTMLQSNWSTLKLVAKELGKKITKRQEQNFRTVTKNSRELKDDKLPISCTLLHELLEASEKMLTDYNSILVRALFVCTWAFFMRICEFLHTGKKDPGHNIRAKAIRTSDVGLSIAFHSDKTSCFSCAIKHRTVRWACLPLNSREIVEKYIQQHPDGDNFFCKNDGRQLSRNDFLNLLDLCLAGTGWVNLLITPHSFRQGRVSQESLEGVDMDTI